MADRTKERPKARGLTKKSTYEFQEDVALELQLYDRVGKWGSQKGIVEESLREWFKRNPIPKKLRDAAFVLLEADNS